MPTSRKVIDEMLPRLGQRDPERGREGRSRLVDEVYERFGYSRKHAITILGGRAGWGGDPAVRKGRPPVYGPEFEAVLHMDYVLTGSAAPWLSTKSGELQS